MAVWLKTANRKTENSSSFRLYRSSQASGRRSQVVRQRSAKPLFIGSIPIAASNPAPRLVRQKPNCQGAGYFPNMCVVARTALKLRVKLNCRSILQTAAKDSDQVPRRRFTKQKSPGVCMRDQTMTQERPKGIKWNATIFMALFHIGAVAALFRFSWRALLVSILLWWITASLGVG